METSNSLITNYMCIRHVLSYPHFKFEFTYKDGKPFLRVLDTSIKRVNMPANTAPRPVAAPMPAQEKEALPVPEVQRDLKTIGLVFRPDEQTYPYFIVDAVQGTLNEEGQFAGKVERLDLGKFVDTEVFGEEDKQLLQLLRKLSDSEVNKYLNRNSPFSGIWDNIVQTNGADLPDETRMLIHEYLHPKLVKIWTENQATEEAGGVYLFKDLSNAEAYLAMHTRRLMSFGVPLVNGKIFQVNEALSKIDRAPL